MPASTFEKVRYAFRNTFSGWEKRALWEGKDILKSAPEDAFNGVWEWNIKDNKVNFSRRWKAFLGYQAHEVGNDISDWERLVHPDDRERTFTTLAMLVKGKTKTGNCEYRILHKDGSYRWILDMAKVISRDGKPLRIIVLQTDITRRKQDEDMLRESEEKYRILLEESNDPIFIFHPDCTFKYANRAFSKAVDMKSGNVIGQSVWHMFPQDEAGKIYATVSEVFAGGQHKVIEIWVPNPDDERYYMTSIDPVKNGDGRVGSVMCTSKDITERKKAEEELLKSRDLTSKVFGNFPVAVYMKDYKKDGQYVIGNKMWEDLQ